MTYTHYCLGLAGSLTLVAMGMLVIFLAMATMVIP